MNLQQKGTQPKGWRQFLPNLRFALKSGYPCHKSDEKALNGELVLVPADEVSLKGLKSDYESMQNMLFGEQPTFEEILEALTTLQAQLNEVL